MNSPVLANVVVELFIQGGPIMYPILVAAIAAVAVVGERIIWWLIHSRGRSSNVLAQVFSNLEKGDMARALVVSAGSKDPAVQMVHHGLKSYPASLSESMQVVAIDAVEKSGRFLPVMDTLITVAPLLGLLGTVTGIMGSFSSIGSSELAVEKVTGGIGEALIATAAGLGIAILVLLPFNFFNRRTSKLSIELQKVGTNLEGLMKRLVAANVVAAVPSTSEFGGTPR